MRKTRLSNAVREIIRNAVIKHRFEAAEKELHARPEELVQIFYDANLSDDDKELIATAPADFFDTTSYFWWSVDGKQFATRHNSQKIKSRRKPHNWSKTSFAGNSKLGKATLKYWADEAKLEADKSQAMGVVYATLQGFKYVEDLVEGWPEIKKFIPASNKKAAVCTLAIPPKELNAMLRLP